MIESKRHLITLTVTHLYNFEISAKISVSLIDLNYEKKIESNCETISKDINDRIEFLKRELDSMKAELQQQLQILKIKLIK